MYKKLIFISRHGDRYPLVPIPDIDNGWTTVPAVLTGRGHVMMRDLGKRLQDEFLTKVTQGNLRVGVLHHAIKRCKDSALNIIDGMNIPASKATIVEVPGHDIMEKPSIELLRRYFVPLITSQEREDVSKSAAILGTPERGFLETAFDLDAVTIYDEHGFSLADPIAQNMDFLRTTVTNIVGHIANVMKGGSMNKIVDYINSVLNDDESIPSAHVLGISDFHVWEFVRALSKEPVLNRPMCGATVGILVKDDGTVEAVYADDPYHPWVHVGEWSCQKHVEEALEKCRPALT